ncbi:helix-turn-helix domain-containing protein [Paenibacillus sp. GCM10023248]|uniref:helix-turn-helix domain-containing protein n=1 Tax=unclassified Paenibacillus TaxID=185978 RepID=UPI0023789A76|nr:helix-turn-helix domain-containing protein [Paenibacillus sp. MAHUQ-63]MDD9271588.1 helix-turn-helix domain-containing protein [Paenibacillus sp. MAHUQ-63]
MKKRFKEEEKLKIVNEALAGVKIGVLARLYDTHPETIRLWVKDYRDAIPESEIPRTDENIEELRRLQEVEERYEKAVKVLGEKELEIEILRELLKKKNPAYQKNLK